MLAKLASSLLLIVMVAAVCGCGSPDLTAPIGGSGGIDTANFPPAMPKNSGNRYHAMLTFTYNSLWSMRGRSGVRSIDAKFTSDDSAGAVGAGEVTLNGFPLPRRVYDTSYEAEAYYPSGHGMPISFDGTSLVFNGRGGAGFPAFSDSVRAPSGFVQIVAPQPLDTLYRSKGFMLRWTGASETGFADVAIISFYSGGPGFTKRVIGDSSLFVTPEDLGLVGSGTVLIMVASGRSHVDLLDGIDRVVSVYSLDQMNSLVAW